MHHNAVVGVQIYLFVFNALPKPFDKYMITPATLTVHADLDTVIFQQPGEFQAGESATLVSIEGIRLAMLVYDFLHRFNAEVGSQGVR
ncbi:hypothetical protein C8R34_10362 [Nitrosomonas sp. Nm84]|nr:hypothetical protein C8R34_10362 [Nitrosomonas sp. Nm84]